MHRHQSPALFLAGLLLLGLTSARGADLAEQRVAAIEGKLGGQLGVAALDTGSGRRILHRSDERFPMCSTFKLLAAAAILQRVDEKQDQLDRFVPYAAADLLEHAPVTRQHVGEGGMKLGALCAAAITVSDNTAANLLLRSLGGPAGITRYARTLGDEKTRLDRMEPDLNSAPVGDERDTTTPAAMVGNLRVLLLGDALSAASRDQLESWLTANETGSTLLRAGLPNDWEIGDKTGRGDRNAINDIAIIRAPGQAAILVAVYSIGSTAPAEIREKAIAEVARVVADSFRK